MLYGSYIRAQKIGCSSERNDIIVLSPKGQKEKQDKRKKIII